MSRIVPSLKQFMESHDREREHYRNKLMAEPFSADDFIAALEQMKRDQNTRPIGQFRPFPFTKAQADAEKWPKQGL